MEKEKQLIVNALKDAERKLGKDYGVDVTWTNAMDTFSTDELKKKLTYIEWLADSDECKHHVTSKDEEGNIYRKQSANKLKNQ
jgi:hypothetical protein|tara:strand:- start:329 stop:577 length:249 start_codon:yes stop_codon:yes gene_type:complete